MRYWISGYGIHPSSFLDVARVAEEAGFHGIMPNDTPFYKRTYKSKYPNTQSGAVPWAATTPFVEPWTTLSAVAAVTTTLHLGTFTYVLPARSWLASAKAIATVSLLSQGRVQLGASAGWMEDQFEIEGLDFRTRGRRFNELVEALRLLWSGEMVTYQGAEVRFEDVQIQPAPPKIPVYIGGDSPAAMRRAARLGDGWIGKLYDAERGAEFAQKMRRLVEDEGRDPGEFGITFALARPDARRVEAFAAAGVTDIVVPVSAGFEKPADPHPDLNGLRALAAELDLRPLAAAHAGSSS